MFNITNKYGSNCGIVLSKEKYRLCLCTLVKAKHVYLLAVTRDEHDLCTRGKCVFKNNDFCYYSNCNKWKRKDALPIVYRLIRRIK